jgi:hypothetical protein
VVGGVHTAITLTQLARVLGVSFDELAGRKALEATP